MATEVEALIIGVSGVLAGLWAVWRTDPDAVREWLTEPLLLVYRNLNRRLRRLFIK